MSHSPEVRAPTPSDAAALWQLVRSTGVLEPNSAYAYLLLCRDFADTCLVAMDGGRVVGFVTAYVPPRRPDSVFVWQIGVAPEAQGRGIGHKLLLELLARPACAEVSYLEATVGTSNTASGRLFRGVARALDCACEITPCFVQQQFPEPEPGAPPHEDEPLYRIGPLRR